MMPNLPISLASLMRRMVVPLLGLGLLGGCSFFAAEEVACPELKARKDYENVLTVGTALGQELAVRVDGVGTACYATDEGHRMDIALGLLITRPADEVSAIENVDIDVTFAFVDGAGNVVAREILSEETFIHRFDARSRSVMLMRIDVPAGSRVVFGLGRAEN